MRCDRYRHERKTGTESLLAPITPVPAQGLHLLDEIQSGFWRSCKAKYPSAARGVGGIFGAASKKLDVIDIEINDYANLSLNVNIDVFHSKQFIKSRLQPIAKK